MTNVRQKVLGAPLQIDEARRRLPTLSLSLSLHLFAFARSLSLPLPLSLSPSLSFSRSWSNKRWSNGNSCAVVQESVRSGWRSGVRHSQQHWTITERGREGEEGCVCGGGALTGKRKLYNLWSWTVYCLKEYGGFINNWPWFTRGWSDFV